MGCLNGREGCTKNFGNKSPEYIFKRSHAAGKYLKACHHWRLWTWYRDHGCALTRKQKSLPFRTFLKKLSLTLKENILKILRQTFQRCLNYVASILRHIQFSSNFFYAENHYHPCTNQLAIQRACVACEVHFLISFVLSYSSINIITEKKNQSPTAWSQHRHHPSKITPGIVQCQVSTNDNSESYHKSEGNSRTGSHLVSLNPVLPLHTIRSIAELT